MKTLIVAATSFEIQPFLEKKQDNPACETLITGVGMTNTAYQLGKHLANNHYNLIINAGIAGSFDKNLMIGEVLEITEDRFAELGAEDGATFLPIERLGFGQSVYFSTTPPDWKIRLDSYKKCTAITVNKVHGHEQTIEDVKRLFPSVSLESMEGAAVFMAAAEENIPVIQLRSISNYVERRNRETWNIPLAIKNLNAQLLDLLSR
ncbi:futalosine hydrolase [Sphingobacterium spiritivorum]|uniref:Futalosine hydrolase n=1 Tax=Sphingobacterium spiritivorum ATCC 33861 TaxID=525373 RepID=D7VIY7_SPHSI|nr:futalosine hydrolase [Sphingobacterium spiritivorum]EFK60039.1 futalosine nucleosidase [Sphingobacterium spiritivorum ATCC 33861]QQT37336.1 futalosine hydrolase [Sphingobacterium spiritivorum]WQD34125.1 futalosine hydrolase [Sphingobacterium spiritivorum]SUJ29810.1 futalosine nucleosidase [Sphingobacterium spiritivorum]